MTENMGVKKCSICGHKFKVDDTVFDLDIEKQNVYEVGKYGIMTEHAHHDDIRLFLCDSCFKGLALP